VEADYIKDISGSYRCCVNSTHVHCISSRLHYHARSTLECVLTPDSPLISMHSPDDCYYFVSTWRLALSTTSPVKMLSVVHILPDPVQRIHHRSSSDVLFAPVYTVFFKPRNCIQDNYSCSRACGHVAPFVWSVKLPVLYEYAQIKAAVAAPYTVCGL
jgi:hypothetical protein